MASLSSLAAAASGLEDPLSSIQQNIPAATTTESAPSATPSPTDESWWEWLTHKADNVEDWVDDFLHKHLPGGGNDKPA